MDSDILPILRDWGTRDLKNRIAETLLRDAADEIERLRTLVVELLPFMYTDSAAGISMSAPPEGHQRDDCDDCDWYYDSLDWRRRIDGGEFDGYKTSGTSSD